MLRHLPILAAGAVALAAPAQAAEIDLAPILTPLFSAVALGLSIGAGYILTWGFRLLRAKTGVQLVELEDKLREMVNATAYRAIEAAMVGWKARFGDKKLEIDNAFLAMAVNYMIKAAPAYLIKLGVTKADGTIDEARVRAMIEARLGTSAAANVAIAKT